MSLTLIELLGIGGFISGIISLFLHWVKHKKDKPIIKIQKRIYKRYLKFEELGDKEYAKAVDSAIAKNPDTFNCEIRNLIVDITNSGYRDAKLKNVLPLYKQNGRNNFSPKVINFHPTTISAGDRESIHLFFEFPIEIIEKIEKILPNTIWVEFDFAHKKIKKKFLIGKTFFTKKK